MRRPPLPIHLMEAWTNSRLLDTATPFTQPNDGKWTFSGFVEGGVGGGGLVRRSTSPPRGVHFQFTPELPREMGVS